MSPEGLITSEFDDAAIIDADAAALASVAVAADADGGEDPDDLIDLELVVLDLTGTTVVDDGLVERGFLRAGDAAGIVESADELERALAFVRPVPGAVEIIRRLRAIGVAVVLTTGLPRATADAVLDAVGWRDLADLTLTSAEAGRGGPYPDLPLTAVLRTGTSTVEGMVVVGDTTADIVSGLAAGAGLVVGVLTGSNDERTLTGAGADVVVASVADLGELLGLDDLERADRLDDDFDDFDDFDAFGDEDAEPDEASESDGADDRPEGQTPR